MNSEPRKKPQDLGTVPRGNHQIKIQNRGSEPYKAISEPRTAVLPRYSAVFRTAVLRVTL